jgi:hypothetical protein
MLFSRRVERSFSLRSQVGLHHGSFPGRPTWDGLWLDVTGLSSLLEGAFDRGHPDGKGLGDLGLAVSGIDCFEHPFPPILRRGFPAHSVSQLNPSVQRSSGTLLIWDFCSI